MADFTKRGAGKGPTLDVGMHVAMTSKRNPGRGAGKGPALDIGSDNTKIATNDKDTGNLEAMPMANHKYVLLPPVEDPSGSSVGSGTVEKGGVAPGRK